jgi:hypothetical protein
MNKLVYLAALGAITFGAPIVSQPAFQADTVVSARGHGGGHHGHHTHRVDYDDDCWPDAIYCPPADLPDDDTVT